MDLASKNPTLIKVDEKRTILTEGLSFCIAINEVFVVKKVYPHFHREDL